MFLWCFRSHGDAAFAATVVVITLRSSAVVIQTNCTDLSRRFPSSNAQQLAFAVKRVANAMQWIIILII